MTEILPKPEYGFAVRLYGAAPHADRTLVLSQSFVTDVLQPLTTKAREVLTEDITYIGRTSCIEEGHCWVFDGWRFSDLDECEYDEARITQALDGATPNPRFWYTRAEVSRNGRGKLGWEFEARDCELDAVWLGRTMTDCPEDEEDEESRVALIEDPTSNGNQAPVFVSTEILAFMKAHPCFAVRMPAACKTCQCIDCRCPPAPSLP